MRFFFGPLRRMLQGMRGPDPSRRCHGAGSGAEGDCRKVGNRGRGTSAGREPPKTSKPRSASGDRGLFFRIRPSVEHPPADCRKVGQAARFNLFGLNFRFQPDRVESATGRFPRAGGFRERPRAESAGLSVAGMKPPPPPALRRNVLVHWRVRRGRSAMESGLRAWVRTCTLLED